MHDETVRLGFRGGCLTAGRWDALHGFAAAVGADVVFGINALHGRAQHCPPGADGKAPLCHALAEAKNESAPAPACCTEWTGSWDPTQARALLEHTKASGQVRGLACVQAMPSLWHH